MVSNGTIDRVEMEPTSWVDVAREEGVVMTVGVAVARLLLDKTLGVPTTVLPTEHSTQILMYSTTYRT